MKAEAVSKMAGKNGGSGWSAMALGECREGPADATGRSAQARGQERWSSQGLRETVGVWGGSTLGSSPHLLLQRGSGHRIGDAVGLGVAYGMDWVKVGLAVRPV